MGASFLRSGQVLALVCPVLVAGCEGCDFSFGPVVYTVQVTPTEVVAEVTLCTSSEGCQVALAGPGSDTGLAGGDAVFWVGHEGYLVCKAPAYELTVAAEGCGTVDRVEREMAVTRAETVIEVSLDCGS